jgi:protocatechuate 4,5-dioxygenase alpha chain
MRTGHARDTTSTSSASRSENRPGRDAYTADPEAYLAKFPMTEEQKQAVRDQDWNRLLELGGNIYYTAKLAAYHGINFQNLAGLMTGMGVEAYRDMMLHGGRPIEGNRYK